MAIRRGWNAPAGISAKGRFYTRYENRYAPHSANNVEYVDKHSGEVYKKVVFRNNRWVGVGKLISVEPKYANFSGSDKAIRFVPQIKPRKLSGLKVHGKEFKYEKPIALFDPKATYWK